MCDQIPLMLDSLTHSINLLFIQPQYHLCIISPSCVCVYHSHQKQTINNWYIFYVRPSDKCTRSLRNIFFFSISLISILTTLYLWFKWQELNWQMFSKKKRIYFLCSVKMFYMSLSRSIQWPHPFPVFFFSVYPKASNRKTGIHIIPIRFFFLSTTDNLCEFIH